MKLLTPFRTVLTLATLCACGVRASVVVADFNDCRLGSLQSSAGQNADTGIGFAAGYWLGNTGAPRVVAGDLTAPAPTGYLSLSGGTAQALSIQSVSSTTRRQQYRSLAAPLGGIVWGSVLVRSADASAAQIGVTFNVDHIDPQNTTTGGKGRLYVSGSSLLLHPWSGSAVTVDGVFSTGTTALILFRQNTATKELTVWINPVLPVATSQLTAATAAFAGTLDLVGSANQIASVGLGGALTTATSGTAGSLDALRLSNETNGYYDVTGLPPAQPPTITVQPVNTLVAPGGSATLAISATGTAPLAYQWHKDGAAIAGATQSSLGFANAQPADAGNYSCVVSNPVSAVSSVTVALSVASQLEAPTVQVSPVAARVAAGGSITFTGTVTGTPPVQFQWLRNGVAITGATAGTLTLTQLSEADSATFSLVASNAAGSTTSAPASLSVQVPPALIRLPQDTVGVVGRSVELVVEATGTALRYQWRHAGVDLAGATAATLTIPALSLADAGSYTVRVANDVGVIESAAIHLVVEATAPAAAGSVAPVGDAYVENGGRSADNFNGAGLVVAARSAAGAARKAYLSFDVPTAIKVAETGSAALQLTLSTAEPYVGSAVSSDGSALMASADLRIRRSSTANQGAANDIATGAISATDDFRALLTFDLSTLNVVSPASVALRLTVGTKDATSAGGQQMLRLYRVTGDWSESQASWTRASSIRNWTTPGSDYGATVLSEIILDATAVAVGDVVTFPSTAALRQAVSEAVATDGVLSFVIIASGEASGQRNLFWFNSREDAGSEPVLVFPPGSVGNASTSLTGNPTRIQLHGLVNNSDAWTENAIAWSDAPGNAVNSATALGEGTALLAETVVDSATLAGGSTVSLTDRRLAQFLNWAAGRRGDLYGSGAQSDADRRITLIVTMLDAGSSYPGVKFVDREGGGPGAPRLDYATEPSAGAATSVLENDRFRATLRADRTVEVVEKASATSRVFSATFDVLSQAENPSLGLSNNITGAAVGSGTTQLNFSVPAWGGNPDYAAAPGLRQTVVPQAVRSGDGAFVWTYPQAGDYTLRASLDLPSGTEAPRLRWTLAPRTRKYFSVAYVGAPVHAEGEVTRFFLPGIWSERRFQAQVYLIDEIRATLPAALVQTGAAVGGVAVDPVEIPNRISTATSSLFALTARTAGGATQATVLAPLYGTSHSNTDASLHFTLRLVVEAGTVDSAFRNVATDVYRFRDYRKNLSGGSLNQTLDNLVDFAMNTSGENYSYWMANEKANDYVNDKPGYARFQSAAATLGLALVRDDAAMYEQRAKPSIEYFISRERSLFKIGAEDPEYPMGGPVTGYRSTDWFALSALSRRRIPAYEQLAQEALGSARTLREMIDSSVPQTREQALDNSFNYLRSLLQAYRTTADVEYLSDARAITDAYITHRLDTPASDFRDVRSSFWNNVSPAWDALLEMQELTGSARYADAAVKSMDQFVRHLNFAPAVNDFSVDASGTVTPTRLVSEVGLPSEAGATSSSHRGIYVPYSAAALVRVAHLSGAPFYAALGKANLVGRYLNYPGYTIRNTYNAAFLQADYPLRFYSAYQNSAHMNHPVPQAAMIVDYLMADAEYRSNRAILFPHQFTDSGAYFRGRLYGQAPGSFYGDTGVWPWLPRGLVSLAGPDAVQLNYVAAHGNGRLYLAFANQSSSPVVATLTINPARATIAPSARLRVWRDNVGQGDGVFVNGSTSITVSPGGLTAIVIDDAAVHLGLQADYKDSDSTPMPADSYSRQETAGWGRVVGTILSLSPQRQSAYVYSSAGGAGVAAVTLHYRIDGGEEQTLTKAQYPFEFSVPLAANTQTFTYWLRDPAGALAATPEKRLTLTSGPIFTSQPPAASTTTAGNMIVLGVTQEGDGPFSYQWRKNGAPIPGATSATLSFVGLVADSGSYDVVVTGPNGVSVSRRSQVTIAPAAVSVSLGGTFQAYTGDPIQVSAVSTPGGVPLSVTYNGSALPPTLPGSYILAATVTDANYTGGAAGVLTIQPTVLLRHAPTLNGTVQGSIQLLAPESVTLNGQARVTSDLLMPGLPTIRLNGSPTYGGTIDATGDATPTTAVVTLNGNASLRHVVRRAPTGSLPVVPASAPATGTRSVVLNAAGQSPGDFTTLLDLTLNGGVGTVSVPAGRYRNFVINQGNNIVLGTPGATLPDVYEMDSLVINGGASVSLDGPAILKLGSALSVNGTVGRESHPEWLMLQFSAGGLTLNGTAKVLGDVRAPEGTVTVNGDAELQGLVEADRLVVNGQGMVTQPPF